MRRITGRRRLRIFRQNAVSNGEVEDCHYIVEEETLEGWKGSSSTEYDKENKTYHITLTNAPIRTAA